MSAEPNSEVVVVVRAFNEARALEPVLSELVRRNFAVIVVDDGSTDETFEVAARHAVTLLRHRVNLGAGAALATGFAGATALGGVRVVATFDADGQHDVDDLERVVEPVRDGRADVVFGSRFLRPADRAQVPVTRRVLLRGAVVVNGLLTGGWLTDAHNGLRAFSSAAVAKIELRESGFAYASELLAEVRRLRLRLLEVPVTIRYSQYSKAKGQSSWNAVNIVLDYLANRIFR